MQMELGPDNHEDFPDEDDLLIRPELGRPAVTIEQSDEIYTLTWDNTVVMTFSVGDGQFDHVRHTTPDETNICIFFCSMSTGQQTISRLMDEDFPHTHQPELDDVTIDLYSRSAALNIDPESSLLLRSDDQIEGEG